MEKKNKYCTEIKSVCMMGKGGAPVILLRMRSITQR